MSGAGFVFEVRVQPRAKREGFTGRHAGALKIALNAPPVDGAANEALIDFLSQELGIRKADVEIVSGEKTRSKRIRVPDTARAQIEKLLTNFEST